MLPLEEGLGRPDSLCTSVVELRLAPPLAAPRIPGVQRGSGSVHDAGPSHIQAVNVSSCAVPHQRAGFICRGTN